MRVACNGTEIYFDICGSELEIAEGRLRSRPTLIALHGGPGFDQGYLRPGLDPLGSLAQIVYPDLRGQGRSAPVAPESCSLEQMADDVAVLCHVLGIVRPFVFGHSAGGFVAMHLALRYPTLAAGLILCNTAPTLSPVSDDRPPPPGLAERAGLEVQAVAARMFAGDTTPASMEAFARLVLPFYAGPAHMDVPARVMALSRLDADIAGHFFAVPARSYDLRPRLKEIAAPSLVLVGSHDWVCPAAAGRAIAAGIPNARLAELPGSGHFSFSEEPALFRHAVVGFLRTIGRQDGSPESWKNHSAPPGGAMS
jgi:proline iminopeptidase